MKKDSKQNRPGSTRFFGREEELARLRELTQEDGLVVVVGPKGSGRSRLIQEFNRRSSLGRGEPLELKVGSKPVEGAKNLVIGGLRSQDAEALFEARRRDFGAAAGEEPTQEEIHARRRLIEYVDGLPAALEVLATRAPAMRYSEILATLEEVPGWLYEGSNQEGSPAGFTSEGLANLSEQGRGLLDVATLFGGGFRAGELRDMMIDRSTSIAEIIEGLNELLQTQLIYAEDERTEERPRPGLYGRRFRVYHGARLAILESISSTRLQALKKRFTCSIKRLGRRLRRGRYQAGGYALAARLLKEEANLRQAFQWADDRDDESVVDLSLSLLAIARQRGEIKATLAFLENVEDRPPPEPRLAAELYIARADLAETKEGIEGARPWWSKAAQIVDRLEDASQRGRIYAGLSEMERKLGNLEAASEPLALARADIDSSVQRIGLAFGAAILAEQGRSTKARALIDELHYLPPGQAQDLECRIWQRIGYACHYLQNPKEQRRAYHEALAFAEECDDPSLRALCVQALADHSYMAGDFDEARRRYATTIEQLRGLSQPHRLAVALGNLATLHHRRGDLDMAHDLYMESLIEHRRSGAQSYEGVVLFALGALHHEQGQAVDARYRYEQANQIYECAQMRVDRGTTKIVQAWLEMEDGGAARARLLLRDAEGILQSASAPGWANLARWTLRLIAGTSEFDDPIIDPMTTSGRLSVCIRDFLQEGAKAKKQPYPTLYERLLQRLLDSRDWSAPLENTSKPRSGWDLAVGAKARWFQLSKEEAVDLSRRSAVRLILDAFVELHLDEPERCFTVDELFSIGWPQDTAQHQSKADRVYWAIRTLRNLGLSEMIVTTDTGYQLRQNLRITRMNYIETI